jgi:NAD+ synthase (glutamine-hydrolysing)
LSENIQLSKELGFLRIGAALPPLRLADIDSNVAAIVDTMREAREQGVQVLAFPEMAITGYTLGDLVQHQALLAKAQKGLEEVLNQSAASAMVVVVGMPLVVDQKIFNCAVVLNSGHILGVIPKTILPGYKEFYENRWFASSWDGRSDTIELDTSVMAEYGFSINDGALFTNQVTVTLKIGARPYTPLMMVSNDGGFAGAH